MSTTVKIEPYTTAAEMGKVLQDNYFEYANRSIALRAIWVDNGWTIICDPELVDPTEDQKIEILSQSLGADIWTTIIQTTSGTYSFSKFSPNKVRHVLAVDGEVLENEGTPLPEETGLNINERISDDDLEALAKAVGFKIVPDSSGTFVIKYLPYGEQMKAQLQAFKDASKPGTTESRPWWKFW